MFRGQRCHLLLFPVVVIRDTLTGVRMLTGISSIDQEQGRQNQTQCHAPLRRHFVDQLPQQRPHEVDHQATGQTKDNGPFQANAAVEIHKVTTVIPPADTVSFFEIPAGKILNDRTDDHGNNECQRRVLKDLPQKQQDQNSPASIDRQPRAIHRSPIDKNALSHDMNAYLPQPARKGERKEE